MVVFFLDKDITFYTLNNTIGAKTGLWTGLLFGLLLIHEGFPFLFWREFGVTLTLLKQRIVP